MKFSEKENLDVLLENVRREPDSYEWNLKAGLLLSGIRKSLLHGEPYLVKALSHGIKDEFTREMLDRLGLIYSAKGLYDKVVDIYRIACDVVPETPALRFRLGDALFRIGRVDEASAIYSDAVNRIYKTAEFFSRKRGEPVTHLLAPYQVVCRYFGEMAAKLDLYLKAHQLGYFAVDRPVLFAPPKDVVNQALIDYWSRYIEVVSDAGEIDRRQEDYGTNWIYLDYFTMPDGRTLHRDIAHRVVQRQWEAEGRGPLLKISQGHKAEGRKILGGQGMNDDDWFVTLHVREAGFFDEDTDWSYNRHRNADIKTYMDAIREITGRGGWVVRLGDPSMAPLPKMERVIDYALGDFRDDWMDIFLIAECRFYLGMPSGPSSVAVVFGVPTVGTNWFPLGAWPYCEGDIFIHKLLRRKDDGTILGIADSLRPPMFTAMEPLFFEAQGLEPVDNSADEIREVVAEMLDRLEGRLDYCAEDDRHQNAYRMLADPYRVGLSPRLGRAFLKRHPELVNSI